MNYLYMSNVKKLTEGGEEGEEGEGGGGGGGGGENNFSIVVQLSFWKSLTSMLLKSLTTKLKKAW